MGKYQSYKRKKKHKKIKGVKYLAYKLIKYYPSRYKSYNQALPRARELYSQIRSEGDKVNVKSFFKYQRKHRKPKLQEPYLDDDLKNPDADNFYYNLGQFGDKSKTLSSNELFFKSTISDSDLPLIQGGVDTDPDLYKKYFSNFVNFLDQKRKENEIDLTSSGDIRIICTNPEYDENEGKWISNIIVTNSDGSELDEDYKKVIDQFDPNELYLTTSYEDWKKSKTETKPGKASADVEAQLQIKKEELKIKKAEEEIKKASVIQKALELLEKGLISHEQFDTIISKL